MLKQIISITGKPGLFRIISNGKNLLIVEDLLSKKRFPASGRDKLVGLGDISMYTTGEDMPLPEIMEKARVLYDGKPVDYKALEKQGALRDEFARVLPDFDSDRVYNGDIRKFFQWYNLLLQAGFDTFIAPEKEEKTEE